MRSQKKLKQKQRAKKGEAKIDKWICPKCETWPVVASSPYLIRCYIVLHQWKKSPVLCIFLLSMCIRHLKQRNSNLEVSNIYVKKVWSRCLERPESRSGVSKNEPRKYLIAIWNMTFKTMHLIVWSVEHLCKESLKSMSGMSTIEVQRFKSSHENILSQIE